MLIRRAHQVNQKLPCFDWNHEEGVHNGTVASAT